MLNLVGKTGEEGSHVLLGFLPFFHGYGICSYLCEGLHNGSTIVTMPKFKPEPFLQTIEQFKVSILHASTHE